MHPSRAGYRTCLGLQVGCRDQAAEVRRVLDRDHRVVSVEHRVGAVLRTHEHVVTVRSERLRNERRRVGAEDDLTVLGPLVLERTVATREDDGQLRGEAVTFEQCAVRRHVDERVVLAGATGRAVRRSGGDDDVVDHPAQRTGLRRVARHAEAQDRFVAGPGRQVAGVVGPLGPAAAERRRRVVPARIARVRGVVVRVVHRNQLPGVAAVDRDLDDALVPVGLDVEARGELEHVTEADGERRRRHPGAGVVAVVSGRVGVRPVFAGQSGRSSKGDCERQLGAARVTRIVFELRTGAATNHAKGRCRDASPCSAPGRRFRSREHGRHSCRTRPETRPSTSLIDVPTTSWPRSGWRCRRDEVRIRRAEHVVGQAGHHTGRIAASQADVQRADPRVGGRLAATTPPNSGSSRQSPGRRDDDLVAESAERQAPPSEALTT